MVWGSMAAGGVGNFVQIPTTMNKEVYLQILENNLLQSATKLRLGRRFTFQQDGDPKHTAKLVTKWLQTKKIKVMEWPAQSPDLNPIEHMWFELENRIRKRHDQPKSAKDLLNILEEEWLKIPESVTRNLVESMPRSVAAVIKANGGHTKY